MNAEPISAYTGRFEFSPYRKGSKNIEHWFSVNPGISSMDTLEMATCILDELKLHITQYGEQYCEPDDFFPVLSLVLMVETAYGMIEAVISGQDKPETVKEPLSEGKEARHA
ncbi:MAG: hypothetical protein NC112_05720 [Oxalobacter formigenes]|nr:hypothetical protein [Oxalobacter formigenes]